MAFSQFLNGQRQEESAGAQQLGLDSITLGQLKAMVGSAPKPKASPCPPLSVSTADLQSLSAIVLRFPLRR
jgi:hypothetical protein